MICWKCLKENDVKNPSRSDECPFCHSDLHSCKNCRFYESGIHYDCRETSSDFISDKERSNFCDYFSADKTYPSSESFSFSSEKSKADAARDAFNALFS